MYYQMAYSSHVIAIISTPVHVNRLCFKTPRIQSLIILEHVNRCVHVYARTHMYICVYINIGMQIQAAT